jgi:hypothetical protein
MVERCFVWLNRNRRLTKDFETTIASATNFLNAASVMLLPALGSLHMSSESASEVPLATVKGLQPESTPSPLPRDAKPFVQHDDS